MARTRRSAQVVEPWSPTIQRPATKYGVLTTTKVTRLFRARCFGNGLVFVSSGYDTAKLYAIDPTGRGDVTELPCSLDASRRCSQDTVDVGRRTGTLSSSMTVESLPVSIVPPAKSTGKNDSAASSQPPCSTARGECIFKVKPAQRRSSDQGPITKSLPRTPLPTASAPLLRLPFLTMHCCSEVNTICIDCNNSRDGCEPSNAQPG